MLSITYFKRERQRQILEKVRINYNEEIDVYSTHFFLLEHPSPN